MYAKFLLTLSFHSRKTFRHFAGNYSLPAHNGIVIETASFADLRLAHANSANNPHRTAKSNLQRNLQLIAIHTGI